MVTNALNNNNLAFLMLSKMVCHDTKISMTMEQKYSMEKVRIHAKSLLLGTGQWNNPPMHRCKDTQTNRGGMGDIHILTFKPFHSLRSFRITDKLFR